jgi:serine phosphatase RsbU (regulator of sigma subunit)
LRQEKLPKCLFKYKKILDSFFARQSKNGALLYTATGRIEWFSWVVPLATNFTEKQIKRMRISSLLMPYRERDAAGHKKRFFSPSTGRFVFFLKTNQRTEYKYHLGVGYETRYQPFGILGNGSNIKIGKNKFLLLFNLEYCHVDRILLEDPSRFDLVIDDKKRVLAFSRYFFDLIQPFQGKIIKKHAKDFFIKRDWQKMVGEQNRKSKLLKRIKRYSKHKWIKRFSCRFDSKASLRNFWKDTVNTWTVQGDYAECSLKSDLGFLTCKRPVGHYNRDIQVKLTFEGTLINGPKIYIYSHPGDMDPKQVTPDVDGYLFGLAPNGIIRLRYRTKTLFNIFLKDTGKSDKHEMLVQKVGGCFCIFLDGKLVLEHYHFDHTISRKLKYCGIMVTNPQKIFNFEVSSRISLLKHEDMPQREPELRLKSKKNRTFRLKTFNEISPSQKHPEQIIRFDDITEIKKYEKKLLAAEREKKEYIDSLEKELKEARTIQRSIIPASLPSVAGLDVAAKFIPSGIVGGDLYDMIPLNQRNVAVLLFDVSGHGLAAAFIASMAKLSFANNISKYSSPSQIMTVVNSELEKNIKTNHFVASVLGILDIQAMKFNYCNCGHIPPLWYRHNDKRITSLEIGGLPLGVIPQIDTKDQSIELDKEDCLFFHTDGLNECTNQKKERYGMSNVKKSFMKNLGKNAETMLDGIDFNRKLFTKNTPNEDDITMLAVNVKSNCNP